MDPYLHTLSPIIIEIETVQCPISCTVFSVSSLFPKTLATLSISLARPVSSSERERERMAASEHTVLQFGTSSSTLTAKIHPLVIFNICDCYVRRPDQAERVIGTLLGSILPDGTVDIRNSYAVPHSESADQVFAFLFLFDF